MSLDDSAVPGTGQPAPRKRHVPLIVGLVLVIALGLVAAFTFIGGDQSPAEAGAPLADEFRARGLRRRVQLPGRPAVELTRRQSEVLELVRRGLSTGEIADRLQISRVTVRRHLGLAVNKLDAKDRAAAVRALEEAEA